MARTEIDVNVLGRSTVGTTIVDTLIPTDGLKVKNDGKTFLSFRNTEAGTNAVTVGTGQTTDNLAIADLAFTLADGSATNQVVIKGPFPRNPYNQSDGYLYLDAGTVDKVYVYAFQSA